MIFIDEQSAEPITFMGLKKLDLYTSFAMWLSGHNLTRACNEI